jgi:hypothetical protein
MITVPIARIPNVRAREPNIVLVMNTYTSSKLELYTIMERRIMHRQRIPARIARSFRKVSGTLMGTWMIIVSGLINPLLTGEPSCPFFMISPSRDNTLKAGCSCAGIQRNSSPDSGMITIIRIARE